MHSSLRIFGAGVIALSFYGLYGSGSHAVSLPVPSVETQSQIHAPGHALRVSDTALGSGGIQTWIRLTELDGNGESDRPAQTLFVPSDAAFRTLPEQELAALLDQPEKRRAFLAGSATATRVTPAELAGRRISVTTLDGRPLVIDGTGEELMVGDAEALDVRMLPDGRVVFVLDHAINPDRGRKQDPDSID